MSLSKNKEKNVIILHGLLMKSPFMLYVAVKMKSLGYNVHLFNYITLHFDKARTLSNLEELCEDLNNIYFIGHSMGGLVIREFIQCFPSKKYKGVVTLGTPHKSSKFAHMVSQSELNNLIGINDHSGLISDLKDYTGNPPLGSIAGNKSKGLFEVYSLFKRNELEEENDGTVFVSETRDKNFSDHIVMNVSHSGMLYSNKIIKQIDYFFKHFKFKK